MGAGIIGCTVAYELAKCGADVEVIETRTPGQGATRASAGILAPYIEGHSSEILRTLGRRSLDLYDGFMTRLRADSGEDCYYQRNGTFELAFSEDDEARLKALAALLQREAIESRWLDPSQFAGLEPHANPNARGALLIPAHGFVAVTALTLAAVQAAKKNGARFSIETGAIRIFATPGNRVGVETSTSTRDADRVVLAAGSWSSQITVDGADPIPVKPIRGPLIQ
ncbi:MAG: FAD-dependent oxidoreductase, partial [Acidobacteriota bacterium]